MWFNSIAILIVMLLHVTTSRGTDRQSSTNECMSPKEDGRYHYNGTQHVTSSGLQCQRWDSSTPHEPYESVLILGTNTLKSMENYCRTPNYHNKPWCYTTHPGHIWEECNISICDENEYSTTTDQRECLLINKKIIHNYHYSGTMSVTVSGKTCQRWARDKPHKVNLKTMSIDYRKNISNYCRQFDEDKSGIKPWCYTTDRSFKWEYCNISHCADSFIPAYTCLGPVIDGKYTYKGTYSHTKTGKPCLRWDSVSPSVPFNAMLNIDAKELTSMENYCRTPMHTTVPWCYIQVTYSKVGLTSWEECGIPRCNDESIIPTMPLVSTESYLKSFIFKRSCNLPNYGWTQRGIFRCLVPTFKKCMDACVRQCKSTKSDWKNGYIGLSFNNQPQNYCYCKTNDCLYRPIGPHNIISP